jgi:hypothetical protein
MMHDICVGVDKKMATRKKNDNMKSNILTFAIVIIMVLQLQTRRYFEHRQIAVLKIDCTVLFARKKKQ